MGRETASAVAGLKGCSGARGAPRTGVNACGGGRQSANASSASLGPKGSPRCEASPRNRLQKPKTPEIRGLTKAGDRGVEPRVAVLETTVLPIHQSPGESEL